MEGITGAILGTGLTVIVGLVSLFVAAWVHKQDHFVPILIFGVAMYLLGLIIATVLGGMI